MTVRFIGSVMPLAHYDVSSELRELKQLGEFLPTRKSGASILLSYSVLVESYITRNDLSFFRVIPSGIAVSSG